MGSRAGLSERLLPPRRLVWPESGSGFAALTNSGRLSLGLSRDSTAIIDFGRETAGGVRFTVASLAPGPAARLRVRLGESVSEAVSGTFADRTLEARPGQAVDVGPTGFRFARIDLLDDEASAELAGLSAYAVARDLERPGSFLCDDDLLNAVWEAGAHTVHLCMQDKLWDGVKRGRSVWAGDVWAAARVVSAVFGDQPVVSESLDHLRDRTIDADGEGPGWMNGIPAYSLWWLVAHEEAYQYHGDLGRLEDQRDYLRHLLPTVFASVDDAGRERFEGWRFFDWASGYDAAATHVGYQGLAAWALGSAGRLCGRLGEDALARRCEDVRVRAVAAGLPATSSKQAWALLALGGVADPAAANREVLARDPAATLTPFLGGCVLDAQAAAGDWAGCLDLIREYWGAMIRLGATTFWEDFDVSWAAGAAGIDRLVPEGARDVHRDFGRCTFSGLSQSLCHGWSAAPTAWLSRHVLGVEPAEPGFAVARIRPRLGNLQWAEGAVPTPRGAIRVRHRRRDDGSVESEVEAPAGVRVVHG